MSQFDTQYQAAKSALAALTQPISDALDALDVAAEVQYLNDQDSIKSLQTQVASLQDALAAAQAVDASDEQKITQLTKLAADLAAQIANMQSVKVFDALEYGPWGINFNAQVGGSGLGTAGFIPPGVESAEFWINPQPPAINTSNYFDCYFSRRLGAFNLYKNFHAELSFFFPTLADANASQCLEFEIPRQLISGKAFVAAFQLQFSGNAIRYWDPVKKWVPTGLPPLARFTPGQWCKIATDCHRDDAILYYDAITINGQRSPLNLTAPAQALAWADDVKYAIQLDGNGKGVPYRVKVDGVKLVLS